MKELMDKVEHYNGLAYKVLHCGRDYFGSFWSDTSLYKDGISGARADFLIERKFLSDYLNFADCEVYWRNLAKELNWQEVERVGYALRLREYFEKNHRYCRKVDFDRAMRALYIHDLLEDEYVTTNEAEQFCHLLAKVSEKALSDACEAYKTLLRITEPNKAQISAPVLDFLFRQKGDMKKRFIAFCSVSERGGTELDATNVVLLLKMVVANDLKGKLKTNGIKLKSLWGELRDLKLIRDNALDNTLNKACQNNTLPKPEIIQNWNKFIKSEAK